MPEPFQRKFLVIGTLSSHGDSRWADIVSAPSPQIAEALAHACTEGDLVVAAVCTLTADGRPERIVL